MAWVAVVRDCIQACHQFGVAELHGLSLMACDDVRDLAGLVAKCLVSCTSHTLSLRRPQKAVWLVLRACFVICTDWLFPPHLRWRRLNKHVELLWAACCACRSVLWLASNSRCKWVRKAGMLLAPAHRHAIWRKEGPRVGLQQMSVLMWTPCFASSLWQFFPILIYNSFLACLIRIVVPCTLGCQNGVTMLALLMRHVPLKSRVPVLLAAGWSMLH